jgi:hypothetical protein
MYMNDALGGYVLKAYPLDVSSMERMVLERHH